MRLQGSEPWRRTTKQTMSSERSRFTEKDSNWVHGLELHRIEFESDDDEIGNKIKERDTSVKKSTNSTIMDNKNNAQDPSGKKVANSANMDKKFLVNN